MAEPLATGPLGMRLLDFARLPEETRFDDPPVGYVLVALWHEERVLFVHVRDRGCWELPGGGIDPGETPRQAAARELREETAETVPPAALRFTGFATTALPGRPTIRGAVYTAEQAAPGGNFAAGNEIDAVHWWDLTTPLPAGRLQTVDAYLARLTGPGR